MELVGILRLIFEYDHVEYQFAGANVGSRIRFALERFTSPRHSTHVALSALAKKCISDPAPSPLV